jgi:tungstate transport system permease protein
MSLLPAIFQIAKRRRTIWPLLNIGREGLLTAFLAAFGRAIAEVGAIIIVGGNIRRRAPSATAPLRVDKRYPSTSG